MGVEIRHFRSFIAVAEEAHIGRAALRLYVSQPAVSRQIQQLEQAVGVELLRRTPRGVELTEEGSELLHRARTLVQATEDALTVGRPAELEGTFTLGLAFPAVNDDWLPILRDYATRYPRLRLETRHALSEHLQRQVASGELDAAVVLAPIREPPLHYSHLQDAELAVWLDPTDDRADRRSLTLAELEGATIALVNEDDKLPSGFNRALRELFAVAEVGVSFQETFDTVPPRSLCPPVAAVGPNVGYERDVARVPLSPRATMSFDLVQREGMHVHAAEELVRFAHIWLDVSGA